MASRARPARLRSSFESPAVLDGARRDAQLSSPVTPCRPVVTLLGVFLRTAIVMATLLPWAQPLRAEPGEVIYPTSGVADDRRSRSLQAHSRGLRGR